MSRYARMWEGTFAVEAWQSAQTWLRDGPAARALDEGAEVRAYSSSDRLVLVTTWPTHDAAQAFDEGPLPDGVVRGQAWLFDVVDLRSDP